MNRKVSIRVLFVLSLVVTGASICACGNNSDSDVSGESQSTLIAMEESGEKEKTTEYTHEEEHATEKVSEKETATEKVTIKETVKETAKETQKATQAVTEASTATIIVNSQEKLIKEKVLTHRLCEPVPMDDYYWYIYSFKEDGKVYQAGYYSNSNMDIKDITYSYYGEYSVKDNKLIINNQEYTYYSDLDYFQHKSAPSYDPMYGYMSWHFNLVPYNGELNLGLHSKFYNYGNN